MPETPTPNARRVLLLIGKVAIAAVVVWFVAGLVSRSLRDFSAADLSPSVGWLVASGIAYIAGLLPMAWFWRRTLDSFDQPCQWRDVLRAYYLGHLGKYVPGKALVVVLRTGALRAAGGQTAPIAASVFVETLTMMAVGGVLASLLLGIVAPADLNQPWLMPLAIGLAVVAAAPTLPPVMSRLLRRMKSSDAPGQLSWSLLATGWASAFVTWLALAGSLWLTIRSLDAAFPLTIETALGCLLAATLPVVAGFLSLLPGGLVVRDGLMLALLAQLPGLEESTALAATVLLRLVWIMSEALACAMLEGVRRMSG